MQVVFYLVYGFRRTFFCGHEQVGRIDAVFVETPQTEAAYGVYLFYGIDLIVPECHAQEIVRIGQVNVYRIAFDPEAPAIQIQVVPSVQAVDQAAEEYVTVQQFASFQFYDIIIKSRRVPHAVNTTDGRDDYNVFPSGQEGGSGRQP